MQTSKQTLILSRILALALLSAVASVLWSGKPTKAHAQAPDPPISATQALVNDVDDIDRMRSLNPLKLTGDQLEKLSVFLTKTQADYDKSLPALASAPLKAISEEIKTTKKLMLEGGAVPKAFDAKVKKIQTEYIDKKNQLYVENIGKVTTECRKILTEDQIAQATKLEKVEYEKSHPGVKATDAQIFNQYTVDVFMEYYRILPLLKEMKAAAKP